LRPSSLLKSFFFIPLIVAVFSYNVAAQYTLDTLIYNGASKKRINIVFFGDGYQVDDLPLFVEYSQNMLDEIFSASPFKEYKKYFNVFIIKTPSQDSGIADFNKESKNTFFSCIFNYPTYGSTSCNDLGKIYDILQGMPGFTKGILLFHGEAAGGWALGDLVLNHDLQPEIIAHEFGHAFGNLADEYDNQSLGLLMEKPNLTTIKDPTKVKWKNWLNVDGIGIFPIGEASPYNKWFVPHGNCKMKNASDGLPYCAVCQEAIVDKIFQILPPVDTFSYTVKEDMVAFSLGLLQPSPNTIAVAWKLNNQLLDVASADKMDLSLDDLNEGTNDVLLEVLDTTAFYRKDERYRQVIHWEIIKAGENLSIESSDTLIWPTPPAAITATEETKEPEIQIYPNPITGDKINFEIQLHSPSNVEITIINTLGQIVRTDNVSTDTDMKANIVFDANLFSSGLYFVRVSTRYRQLSSAFIKR
jgi:hypothetical protein